MIRSFVFLFFIFLSPFLKADQLFILPYENKKALKELIRAIKNAQTKIDIAIYSFTHKDIAKSLRDVASQGIKINIIFNEPEKSEHNDIMGYLAKYENIHVCTLRGLQSRNKSHYGIMHQKMMIIDDSAIVFGSANWSRNAFENSYETLFISENRNMIEHANIYYKKMFSVCKEY